MASPPSLASRIRGSFFGLAVCDALGGPVEFKARGTFPTVTSMQPNENLGLGPGYFTDDTSMALCLAHSFLEHGARSNSVDQASKYLAWYRSGYQSSAGFCFDIGNLTHEALGVWKHAVVVNQYHGENGSSPSPQPSKVQEATESALATVEKRFNLDQYCGNGSLMRVLPAALVFGHDLPTAVEAAADSSRITHPHPRCTLSCVLYTILVAESLQTPSVTKDTLVSYISNYISTVNNTLTARSNSKSRRESNPVSVSARALLDRFEPYTTLAVFRNKPATAIRSSGYVVDSLEAALWAFFTTDSFRDGAIKAVNLGDDADTVGAIYGGLAGAFYGDNQIPSEWLKGLQCPELVEDVITKIVEARSKDEADGEGRREGEDFGTGDIRERIRASVDALNLDS